MERASVGDRWAFGRPHQPFVTPRKRRWSFVSGFTVVLMTLATVALADTIRADSDYIVAGVQTNTITVDLAAGGSTTVTVGVQVIESGQQHAGFSVPVTAGTSNVTGTPLGAPSDTSLSVTGYGDAGQDTTDVPVSAPPADELDCGVITHLVGRITFTTSASGFQGNNNTDTRQINVDVQGPTCPPTGNTAPDVTITSGATAVYEGGAATTYSYTWTDPDANTWTQTTTCGATGVKSNEVFTPASKSGSFKCAWADDVPTATPSDVETVSVTVSDGTASDTDTRSVTVSNVAPNITSAAFGSGGSCTVAATLNFEFSDPGTDTWDAQIDWDYNGTFSADETKTGVSKSDSASHTYSTAGSHTAAIKIVDDDTGASAVQTATGWVNFNLSQILQPINDTGHGALPSVFKYGSTIPVKVEVTDCDGSTHPNSLTLQVTWRTGAATTPVGELEVVPTSQADLGNTMRFSDPLYVLQLNSRNTTPDSTCAVTIWVSIMNGTTPAQSVSAYIGFKK